MTTLQDPRASAQPLHKSAVASPSHDVHVKTYPLPKSEFMYERCGPWPQPAPDHPMAMAAEVLHLPKSETRDWFWHSGLNYITTLLTKLPRAAMNAWWHGFVTDMDDGLFAELLTTTIYSKYLRRGSLQKHDDLARALGLGDSKDYFVMDFTPMQDIQPYPGMFVSPTVTVFVRDGERGPFRPLGCSVGTLVDGRWQLTVMHADGGSGWQLAKYFALQGAGHVTTLAGHPATHFPYDTVNAITKSAVPMKHTMFKLLFPHLRLALAVDNAVLEGEHSVVSQTRGEIYAPYVAPGSEVRQLVAAGYVGYPHPLSKYAADQEHDPNYAVWTYPLQPREIPSDFGRFLKAYHTTIKDFVREVVTVILSRRGTPQGDEEIEYIRNWAHHISLWLRGFPDANRILQEDAHGDPLLVSAITTYIWDVSVAHSLDHHSFYGLTPRHTPFRMRVAPPVAREVPGFDRKKILNGWDLFKSTLAFEMFFKPHNVVLLEDADYGFTEPALKEAVARFMKALRQTEQDLIAAGVDVQKYAPLSKIATSIQY